MICCGSNCCASCALFSRCTSCQTSGCRIFCLVRPGCFVCPWAAARPPSTAHDLPGSVWSLCVPVGGGPPASRPRRVLMLVAPLVFRAPEACLEGPGRCVCRWAAARPGPAATHRHRDQALRTLRRPPHQWGRVAVRQLYVSARSPARPLTSLIPEPHPISHAIPRHYFKP